MSMPAEIMHTGTNLRTLLDGLPVSPAINSPAISDRISVNGIATDSREVGKGYLFLACAGEASHGIEHAGKALAAGAAAIVYDSDTAAAIDLDTSVPVAAVPGLQQHIGLLANRWFDYPSSALSVSAITGTNGKTTVAMLFAHCMQLLGRRCGYIGTLGKGIDELTAGGGLTSPTCLKLHEAFAEFRDDGATHAAIEVSSHALAQNRIDGVDISTAVFTNLSRDHIDYHGDMQSYFEAKAQLFAGAGLKHRIVNIDSEFGLMLADRCDKNVLRVSTRPNHVTDGRPFVFVQSVVAEKTGSRIQLDSSWGNAEFRFAMPGDFNVENAAIIFALLLRNDVPISDACEALEQVSAPPGRMQLVNTALGKNQPAVYVDFAHTPASLESAIQALRAHCNGDLWCVFGCGGDRDRGKRSQMGEIVSRLAQHGVVTNDNPRNEDPVQIIDDILTGMNERAVVVEDRATAIAYAIREAADADMVLIAGKGHEAFQIIGHQSIPFSDYASAFANLEARGQSDGSS